MRFGRVLRFTQGANEARASSRLAFAACLAWAARRTHAPLFASGARLTAPLATLVVTTETSAYNHATFPLPR